MYQPPPFYLSSLPDTHYEPSINEMQSCCPALANKVMDACHAHQAPLPMVIQSGLSVCSYLLQNLVRVQVPYGDTKPCGLYLLTIAESGERKSAVDKFFYRPIKELKDAYQQEYQDELDLFELTNKVWAQKKKKLLKEAAKETASEDPDSPSCIDALYKHEKNKPKKPALALKTFEDTTTEALLDSIHTEQVQSVMLKTDEGDMILSGHAARNLPVWNKLWDLDTVELDRKKEGRKRIKAATTLFIQVQPGAFENFVKKKDGQAMDVGFLPRAIFCFPQSTQGIRFKDTKNLLSENSANLSDNKGSVARFDKHIEEFFHANIEASKNPEHQPKTLTFSPEAEGLWYVISNSIETRIQPNGLYANFKGHASKLMENISRVAALLHALEHGLENTQISRDILLASTNLCIGFSNHFIRYFTQMPEEMKDYQQLLQWLNERPFNNRYLLKNYIRQYGPNCIRSKGKLDVVLDAMQRNGVIKIIKHQNKLIVDLSPSFPEDTTILNWLVQHPPNAPAT